MVLPTLCRPTSGSAASFLLAFSGERVIIIMQANYTIDTIPRGTGLETAIFHTPMRVMPDVIPDVLLPRKCIA